MQTITHSYRSDGSDGYTSGTYGYHVRVTETDGTESTWHEGGYSGQEHADETARRFASRLRREYAAGIRA